MQPDAASVRRARRLAGHPEFIIPDACNRGPLGGIRARRNRTSQLNGIGAWSHFEAARGARLPAVWHNAC